MKDVLKAIKHAGRSSVIIAFRSLCVDDCGVH